MKNLGIVMAACMALALCGAVQAASIGVNPHHTVDETQFPRLAATDNAGYTGYAQTNWNNIFFGQYIQSTSQADLNDNTGSGTTADLVIRADPSTNGLDNWVMFNDASAPPGSHDEPNERLMTFGASEAFSGSLNTFYDVTDIPYDNYTLVIYACNGDYIGNNLDYPTVDFTITATTGSTSFSSDFVDLGGEDGWDKVLDLNEEVFVVTGLSGDLTIQAGYADSGEFGAGITGFQIIEAGGGDAIPEPASAMLVLIGMGGLALLRRKS